MRLFYKSRWYKFCCVLRYFITRLFHFNRFHCNGLSMIGKRCGIHIFKEGQIQCKGRIIINDDSMLYAKGHLDIGKCFNMNSYSRIVAHDKIIIGNNVTIGQFVAILDHDHKYEVKGEDLQLTGFKTAPVKIGNNVWIADKCTILKGVTIGNNVVVGANTLIHKDIPNDVVVGGNPFKILKRIESE